MKIIRVEITNFRNLIDIEINFHKETNFIIGENNIGKSNFFDLLTTIGNSWGFLDSDFKDPSKPIMVVIMLSLYDYEIGLMGGSCSPLDANIITICISQSIEDNRPTAKNNDTDEQIPYSYLRRLNFSKFDTLRNPSDELKLDNPQSSSSILRFFIEKHIENNEVIFEESQFVGLLNFVNENLRKLKAFKDFSINAAITGDSTDVLGKIITLIDENDLPMTNTGNGIQFSAMASLNIFRRILQLYNAKSGVFDELVIITEDNQKNTSIVACNR